MSLSQLSILLGVGIAIPQVWQIARPNEWRRWSTAFPRSQVLGWVLVLGATAWFLRHVHTETLADFSRFKPYLLALFGTIGVLTCVYVNDFLAARGFALMLMLVAKLMVDTARWHESEWRWIVSALAYVWVFFGMWFTISPWRLRDFLEWHNRTDQRIRICALARLALAALLVVLGLTAYRTP